MIQKHNLNSYLFKVTKYFFFFRMPIALVQRLVNLLYEYLIGKRSTRLSPEIQVLVALRFYSEGPYQKGVARDYRHPLSQSSVSRIINRVSNAIIAISGDWIRLPETREERYAIQLG